MFYKLCHKHFVGEHECLETEIQLRKGEQRRREAQEVEMKVKKDGTVYNLVQPCQLTKSSKTNILPLLMCFSHTLQKIASVLTL